MLRTSFWRLLVTALLVVVSPGTAPAAVPGQGNTVDAQETKADKEQRKREEQAAKRDLQSAKEFRDIRAEIQPEVDALGIQLLRSRYDDRFLQDYINEMGQRLVPPETPPGVLFSFRVVNDAVPNAMALPDGRIYVNSGLLAFVENEAQLAMVLGHEIGHVIEQHAVESIKEGRSFKRTMLPGILGGIAGAVTGGLIKGKEGAAVGAGVGVVAGVVFSAISLNDYSRKQEDEADRLAVQLTLASGYDSNEGVAFFRKLTETFHDQDRFTNLLWGRHSRNVERISHIQALLGGDLSSEYNDARSAGRLTLGTGQMHLYASRMFRDVAIQYMDEYDRWDISKGLLEKIADYRASDPKTLWALGRVHKMVGRTDAERARALDFLQRAADADQRHRYPFIYRDLALMQSRQGAAMAPAAVESVKKYIRGHIDVHGVYPDDIEEMYDYLLIFGDSQWTAPELDTMVIATAPRREPAPPVATDEASSPAVRTARPVATPKRTSKPRGK